MADQPRDMSSIMVGTFRVATLRDTWTVAKVIFDSYDPEEIIDIVVIGKDALERKVARNLPGAVIENVFYEINRMMADSPPPGG